MAGAARSLQYPPLLPSGTLASVGGQAFRMRRGRPWRCEMGKRGRRRHRSPAWTAVTGGGPRSHHSAPSSAVALGPTHDADSLLTGDRTLDRDRAAWLLRQGMLGEALEALQRLCETTRRTNPATLSMPRPSSAPTASRGLPARGRAGAGAGGPTGGAVGAGTGGRCGNSPTGSRSIGFGPPCSAISKIPTSSPPAVSPSKPGWARTPPLPRKTFPVAWTAPSWPSSPTSGHSPFSRFTGTAPPTTASWPASRPTLGFRPNLPASPATGLSMADGDCGGHPARRPRECG
jgi:hypothetical protein